MEKQKIVIVSIVFSIVASILWVSLALTIPDGHQDFCPNRIQMFDHLILMNVPFFILSVKGKRPHKRPYSRYPDINSPPKRDKKDRSRISIFKGVAVKKNKAILKILFLEGPLDIGEIQRRLNKKGFDIIHHGSLDKRIHVLERGRFIQAAKPTGSKPFVSRAVLYDARNNFYLANFLNSKKLEEVICKLSDSDALVILSVLINAYLEEKENKSAANF